MSSGLNCEGWLFLTWFMINPITSISTGSGLLELWSPSNIFRYLILQGHAAYNFYEFLLLISWSWSPVMKTTTVSGLKCLTDSLTSSSSTSYSAFLPTSFLSLENTQGKKQFIMKLGTNEGECSFATCLQRLLNDLYEESATMNSVWP